MKNLETRISTREKRLDFFFAFFPVLMTILTPYSYVEGGIALCDVAIIIIFLYFILHNKIRLFKPLTILLILDFCLTLIAFLGTKSVNTDFMLAIKVCIVFFMYLMVYSSIWSYDIKDNFLRIIEFVGVACALLAIFQFVFSTLGYKFFDGRLFLPLKSGGTFGGLYDRNTHDLRVHSLFSEPSYLGIFELPLIMFLMQKKKYSKAIICAIACIISGSLIGIIGVIISFCAILLIDKSVKHNQKIEFLVIIVIAIFGIIFFYNSNASFRVLMDYYIERGTTLELSRQSSTSSFSQRIFGNINLFHQYGEFNKFVGVGFNQYSLFFGIFKDYSNDFVSNLLNFGYVGILVMVSTLIWIIKSTSSQGKVLTIVLILVLCTDHSWFGPMFFYLITWLIVTMDIEQLKKVFVRVRY